MPTFLTPQQYIQFTKVHLYRKVHSDQKRWLNFGWQHTLIICGWALEVKLKVQRYRKNICEYGIMRHNAPLQRHVKTPQPIILFFFCECIKSFSLSLWFISFVSLLLVMVIIHHFVVPLCLLILMLSVCSHFGFFYGDFFITCLPVSPVPGRHI